VKLNHQGSKKRKNDFTQIIRVLDPKTKKKLINIVILQTFMGFLDLFGVVAIGAVGALSIQGIESQKPGTTVSELLKYLGLNNFAFQSQVAFLGLLAALALVIKTLLSIYLTRKTLFFLSQESAKLSTDLMNKFLSKNIIEAQDHPSQETIYALSDGVKNLFMGVLGTAVTIFVDFTMLLIMAAGLLLVDPIVALATLVLFGSIGLMLYKVLNVRAKEIGSEFAKLNVLTNQKILEVLNSARENIVRNRQQFYADQIRVLRQRLGAITAEVNFQPYITKYVIETSTVLGALALASYEFGTKNAVHAVATLAVFITASSRIAPAALRIQQGYITLRNSQGSSQITLQLISDLKDNSPLKESSKNFEFEHSGFVPCLKINSATFEYPGKNSFSLKDINLRVESGSVVAIVGPSGAGKSTLVDLILGVLSPNSGEVIISNTSPKEAAEKWSGAIAYVPQNIFISSGTIRENVSLGYPTNVSLDDAVWKALDDANLRVEVEQMQNGLESQVGENGIKLSGGQRQRLGIARAFFTSPKLIILDEATSALDAQSEALLSEALENKSRRATVIVVAHRLSTVKNSDLIVYLDNGSILSAGTFEQVRQSVPNFDQQAKLMGL